MSTHNTGNSSRKPSGSSTNSGGHSPTGSQTNVKPQRKLASGAAGNVFGSMGGPNSLKGLNSGWQVWPSSKRNASVSSAASVAELSPQGDSNYRGNLGEGWTISRPTSGSPQKTEFSQLDSHSPLALHHARQRQVQGATFPVPRVDERPAGSKPSQFSPQRYDMGLMKDASTSRYSSPAKPAGFGGGSYMSQPSGLPSHPGYEILQTSSIVENDLSLALRGMAVEDEYSAGGHQVPLSQSMPDQGPNPQMRPPPIIQHTLQPVHRNPYGVYPRADYSQYYNGPGREPYIDYQYGYDAYRVASDPSLYPSPGGMSNTSPQNMYPNISSPSLHPNTLVELHRQHAGIFYDYGTAARPPGSQFYYPAHQAVIYPPPSHSPMLTPQSANANPVTLADRKRDLQYNIQQQLASQNLMFTSLRSTPSPHPQVYVASLEYGTQLPVMHPGSPMYGHGINPHAMHIHQQGMLLSGREGTEPSVALRSPLLEEFRADKARKWEFREVFGYIVEFSGDQYGSRFIQQKLETATSEEKQIAFDEIVPNNILQLIQDVFGNYVVQKLFEHGTQVQKTILANAMEGHILPLSLQMYGCRVVQKAVECILPHQQSAFVKELDAHVLKCVKDANGNHVIQKLIERVSSDRLAFVNTFRGNVYDLATHPYGCRVLQRCFERLPDEQARPLLDELHRYSINLMQDQFGNYVMQFILEHGKPQDRALVLYKLRGQMLHMARHKFASNVCEKALITADAENRRILIDELMTPKQDGVSPIATMMKDQYANYVLQRALASVEGEQKQALIAKVRPQLVTMRRYSSAYSKHLVAIERLLEICSAN